ncbi:MAG: T9SS type A sorting domain-containing protein [Bacteroidia bacterium]|nr:T9SS type A sorting domain-containing protein [Bacteroidia bacterium]
MKKVILLLILNFLLFNIYSQTWTPASLCKIDEPTVLSLHIFNNKLYIGGGGALNFPPLNNFAFWDGNKWDTLSSIFVDPSIHCISDFNNDIFVGGMFNGVYDFWDIPYISKWNDSSWDTVGTIGFPSSGVMAMCKYNNELYVGGFFSNIGGNTLLGHVAKWDGVNWHTVGNGIPGWCVVHSLAVYNNELYVGGTFAYPFAGIQGNFIVRWDGTQWKQVGNGLNGYVNAMTVDTVENVLYVGGWFTMADDTVPVTALAKWDGSQWSAVGSGINSDIAALAMYHGDLYAGGYFDSAGSVIVNYIARWDGTNWDSLSCGLNATAHALAVYNDSLFVGGIFTTAGGDSAYGIAKWYRSPDTPDVNVEVIMQDANCKMQIYPNPFEDSFTVEFTLPADEKGMLKFYNMKGELHRKFILESTENKTIINTADWQAGTYLCRLVVGDRHLKAERVVVGK